MSEPSPAPDAPAFASVGGGNPTIVDLNDAVTVHQLALAAAGRSPQTLRLYLLYETRFLGFLRERHIPPTLDALSPINVRQAVLWFQQRHVGARHGEIATAQFLKTLKTWANFLEQEGVYQSSPLQRIKPMRVRQLERHPYTRAEVNAILHACAESRQPERDRLLVELLLRTGLRISEATGLRVQDVDLRGGYARVLGKGNRERAVPIRKPDVPDGGPLPRAIRAWLKVREGLARRHPERSRDRLFLTLTGYPLSGEGGTTAIKRLGAAAGVDGAIPHRFRHSYITNYLTRWPNDTLGLRRIVGHVSDDVLAVYEHLAQATLAQRAGRVDPTDDWLHEA